MSTATTSRLIECTRCSRDMLPTPTGICANCDATLGRADQPSYVEDTTALQAGHAESREIEGIYSPPPPHQHEAELAGVIDDWA